MHELTVDLGVRSYPIYIGAGLLTDSALLMKHVAGDRIMVVTNETVAPLYLDPLLTGFGGVKTHTTILPDGEQYKNLETLNQVFDALLEVPCDRRTTVVALGGGVVGDIAGFAAACYQRGVPLIQVPTTLLAQVDSSVGGKTAVNHPLGKNMIGAFYQPQAVFADISTLNTLPDRELRAGLAEVIKYGLICDYEFFSWLEQNIERLMLRDMAALEYAIERSCSSKARVVAEDEREAGTRALLNFGHTFGHAIETATGYGSWLHGEAVAAGMVMAAELSASLGNLSVDDLKRIVRLVDAARLPGGPPSDVSIERFLGLMRVDKKVRSGTIRLVLLKSLGHAYLSADYPADKLRQTLQVFGCGQAGRDHRSPTASGA